LPVIEVIEPVAFVDFAEVFGDPDASAVAELGIGGELAEEIAFIEIVSQRPSKTRTTLRPTIIILIRSERIPHFYGAGAYQPRQNFMGNSGISNVSGDVFHDDYFWLLL
jgi:hypothetical protein